MAIALALLAAGANAFATILQRIGVEEATSNGRSSAALMAGVLRRPVWFGGLGLAAASFFIQALALYRGNLSTVQPVMVTEIVFLVIILCVGFDRPFGWQELIGASGTALGLGAFLALSSATGGTERPGRSDWLLLIAACVGAVLLAYLGAHRGSRLFRAACYGVAAAVCFALTAAFVKTVSDQWSQGAGFVFTHFEAYGVAIAGLAGFVISQRALDAGPVAASQTALLVVNPVASIIMGIWLFGDHIGASGSRLGLEVVALIVMFLSLTVLANSPLISPGAVSERLSRSVDAGYEGGFVRERG